MSKRDLIAIGRSSIDLYSQDIGVPFKEISGFNAFVGGSPLNISVGCSRLGLKSTLLTAVGKDKVGEFILNYSKDLPIFYGLTSVILAVGLGVGAAVIRNYFSKWNAAREAKLKAS